MTTFPRSRTRQRRTRLYAWLCDPHNDALPNIAKWGFDYKHALWSAEEIVEFAGVYQPSERSTCLADLRALQQEGKVERWGDERDMRNRRWSALRKGVLR